MVQTNLSITPMPVVAGLYTVLPALRCHLRFLAIKPFLLGVKTSGFKRKICFIESTIVPSYNSIMGAIFEYDINQA